MQIISLHKGNEIDDEITPRQIANASYATSNVGLVSSGYGCSRARIPTHGEDMLPTLNKIVIRGERYETQADRL